MGFDLLTPIVLDIQIWASFDPILEWHQNKELGMGHNITIIKNWSEKWIANLKETIVIEFDLFITVTAYKFDPFKAQFWLYDVTRIVKFPNFEKMTEDQIFHIKKHTWLQVQNFVFLLGRNILLWNCFVEFGKVTSKRGPVSHLRPNNLQTF